MSAPFLTHQKNSARLWIDGVGSFLVFLQDRVTLGGVRESGNVADIAIRANLNRFHAEIERDGEDFWLLPHGTAQINGRDVHSRTLLQNGYQIRLGHDVEMKWTIPSSLSASANLKIVSSHPLTERTDGLVFLSETCLMGPGETHHIDCRKVENLVVLFREGENLMLPAKPDYLLNDREMERTAELNDGDLASGPDFRFRIERRIV